MGQGVLRTSRRDASLCERVSYYRVGVESQGQFNCTLFMHAVCNVEHLLQGVSVAQYKPGSVASPPAPPPPPPPAAAQSSGAKAPAGGAAAVFAELNKGEAVTKGLRKVDKSEMTHKNPSLRAGSAVPERSVSPTRK